MDETTCEIQRFHSRTNILRLELYHRRWSPSLSRTRILTVNIVAHRPGDHPHVVDLVLNLAFLTDQVGAS
jgi:hypothetical protein